MVKSSPFVHTLAAFSIATDYSAATSNNYQQDEQNQDKTDIVVEGAAYISRHYTMHLLVIKYSVMYENHCNCDWVFVRGVNNNWQMPNENGFYNRSLPHKDIESVQEAVSVGGAVCVLGYLADWHVRDYRHCCWKCREVCEGRLACLRRAIHLEKEAREGWT